MTGVLENMMGRLEAAEAAIQRLQQAGAAAAVPAQAFQQPQQFAPQQPQQQFAPQQPQQFAPQQPTQQAVTADMITALVAPMVDDPAVKLALQQQMQAMGIQGGLQEAQPHQYAELYARFMSIKQQVDAQRAAAPQSPMQQAAPASII